MFALGAAVEILFFGGCEARSNRQKKDCSERPDPQGNAQKPRLYPNFTLKIFCNLNKHPRRLYFAESSTKYL